jgi:oligopeptidase B
LEASVDRSPVAPKRPYTHVEHDVSRDDPWFWLRDRADPAVIEHLEAENRWTEQRTAHLSPLRTALYREMLGRIQETDETWPVADGPYEYYSRTEAGRPYRIWCRRPRGGGPEEILLDVNVVAEGHAYTVVSVIDPSPDHRTLAYTVDHSGQELFQLRFRDLATGRDLPDVIEPCAPDVTWADDSRTVLWCELDATQRPFRVHRRTLGDPASDAIVYAEPEDRFRVATWRSRSNDALYVMAANASTIEIHRLDPDDPRETVCLEPRTQGHRYKVALAGGRLFVVSNREGAVDGALYEADPDAVGAASWVVRLAHRPGVELVDADGFRDHLVLTERDRGQLQLRVLDLRDGRDRIVPVPERPSVARVGDNPEYDSPWLRFGYTSLTTPETVFRIHLDTFEVERLKELPVPGYDRTRYRTTRVEARADDGTLIPISMVYRADLDPTRGPHPLLLSGYGAYGISLDPDFNAFRPSLLDRGVVCAIAHVRGGGFMGRDWYESGKFDKKKNTFTDFLASARHLVAMGATAPERLAIYGGSAGGLLIGAAMNEAPELFHAALAVVPFVDIVTTMLDETLPLTAGEWEEWGDPRKKYFFDYMLSYSPYDNVRPLRYPNLLAVGGLNDPRVQYWEPTKWVAKLRDVATGGEFLLKTHMGAGHGGRSGRYGLVEDKAFEYAWLLDQLRATERPAPSP